VLRTPGGTETLDVISVRYGSLDTDDQHRAH